MTVQVDIQDGPRDEERPPSVYEKPNKPIHEVPSEISPSRYEPPEEVVQRQEGTWGRVRYLAHKAMLFGRVEVRGIAPIPVMERTSEKTVNVFTLWWSINFNILP